MIKKIIYVLKLIWTKDFFKSRCFRPGVLDLVFLAKNVSDSNVVKCYSHNKSSLIYVLINETTKSLCWINIGPGKCFYYKSFCFPANIDIST